MPDRSAAARQASGARTSARSAGGVSVIAGTTHRSINAGPRNIAARRLVGMAMACIAASTLSGCYAFIPNSSAVLPEATPVTVSLTLAGTVALGIPANAETPEAGSARPAVTKPAQLEHFHIEQR